MSDAGALDVDGLTWRPFGRREPVLRSFSLSVPAGQRVLLAGPSGSGKSTLLRAFAGLLQVADSGDLEGTVTVDGAAPGSRAGSVGLVLQEPGSGVVASTVGRDVAFGLENVGMPREQMPVHVTEALAAVHLHMPQDTPTYALSGGEQQRLALAGALALRPRLLLLDEPTAMLDPVNAASVRESVAEVSARAGLTTVVVEHLLEPWVDFADRLVAIDSSGRILADGAPRSVLATHGEALAAQGVWVPGVPAPEPLTLAPDLLAPEPTARRYGEPAIAAGHVSIQREVLTLNGTTRKVLAVRDQSVMAYGGRVTTLVGASGSGKSTLLLALTGLIGLSAGEVTAEAASARTQRPMAGLSTTALAEVLAWVPQWSSSTIVAHTVLDEVLTTSRALGRDETSSRARAELLLKTLGLGHLLEADPRQLSGGEQRRLAMVSAVLHAPAALLADEPTVGQDRHTWAAVMGLIEAMRAAGSAVVVATHDQSVIEQAGEELRLTKPQQAPEPTVRRPLAARCNPLSLLLASMFAIPAGIISPRWQVSVTVLACQLVLGALALLAPGRGAAPSGRGRRVALRFAPGVVAAVSVGWSTWLLGSHDLVIAATAALRVMIIVFPSAVLIPYIDADALGDHLAQRLHLPARPVVALSAALQRLNSFGDIWGEIRRARQVRGIGAGRSPRSVLAQLWALTVGMLVRSLGSAAQLAVAMDARGFSTAYERSWYAAASWTRVDTAAAAAGFLPVLLALGARLT